MPSSGLSVRVTHHAAAASCARAAQVSSLLRGAQQRRDPRGRESRKGSVRQAAGSRRAEGLSRPGVYVVYTYPMHVRIMCILSCALHVRAYLDQQCLKDGEGWEEGFMKGLTKSRLYVLAATSHTAPRSQRSPVHPARTTDITATVCLWCAGASHLQEGRGAAHQGCRYLEGRRGEAVGRQRAARAAAGA